MRIKELFKWLNGITQTPKYYRSYKIKESIRAGSFIQVLAYVIIGKRFGLNSRIISDNGGWQFNGEGGLYIAVTTKGDYVELKIWKHQEHSKDSSANKLIHNCYLENYNLWEKKYKFWFLTYCKYSIRIDGKMQVNYRLLPKNKAKRIYRPKTTKVYITRDEWVNEYSMNKYLVPVNYDIPEEFLQ